MNKLQRGILTVAEKIAFGLFGLMCVYLFLNSIFSTCVIWYDTLVTYYIKDFPILLLGGIFALIGMTILWQKWIRKVFAGWKQILSIATVVWVILLLIFMWNTDIALVQDQGRIYAGMEALIHGDTELWEVGGYFYNFPYLNGMVLLLTPIMLVFGEYTYAAVQVVNLIFFWLLAWGCYKLSAKIFSRSVAVCSYVAVLYFIPLWSFVKFFYGNLIGLSLTIWGIYWLTLYLENKKTGNIIKCTACALLATMVKTNYSIFVVAMLIVLFVEAIREKKLKLCVAGIGLLLSIVIGMQGPSWVVHMINGCDTGNGLPTIHWIKMGLRESYLAPGWYSGDAAKWFEENQYSVELAKESARQEINDLCQVFMQEKDYALRFFTRKFASAWNNPSFESFALIIIGNLEGKLPYWMKDIVYNGGIINTILTVLLDVLHSFYLFGAILYLICCKKEHEIKKAIPLIAFIGGVLFHTFWETRAQYTTMYFVPLFPYAFAGYRKCVRQITEWRTRKERPAFYKSGKVKALGVLLAIILVIAVWDNTLFTSTVKLQGQEADYMWICREYDYWKADDFTKDSTR